MVKWRYTHFPYLNIGVLKRLFSGGLRRIMEARKSRRKINGGKKKLFRKR